MAVTTVGVLGTGRMGSAMARALAAPGVGARPLEPDRGARRGARRRAAGGAAVATRREAAAAADVCVTMVADDGAVERGLRRPGGLIAGRARAASLIDLRRSARHDPGHRAGRPRGAAPACSTRRSRAASPWPRAAG